MSPEPHKQEQEQRTQHGNPRSPRTKHRSPILGYMVLLFLAAFVLLVLSYFMQQRRNDQAVIDGLQQSISAMQTKQNISDQNKDLTARNDELSKQVAEGAAREAQLQQQLDTLTGQAQALEQENSRLNNELTAYQEDLTRSEQLTLALDWLWRIEREYFKGRYAAARELIRQFMDSGLVDTLPTTSLVDPEYRSPREQYDSIYAVLF